MVNMTPTERANQVVDAIGEAIQSLGSIPSGHLYARVMSYMTLDMYQNVITILVKRGSITNKGHMLTWVGK